MYENTGIRLSNIEKMKHQTEIRDIDKLRVKDNKLHTKKVPYYTKQNSTFGLWKSKQGSGA